MKWNRVKNILPKQGDRVLVKSGNKSVVCVYSGVSFLPFLPSCVVISKVLWWREL